MVELEEGGGSAAPRLVGHPHQQPPAQVGNTIKQSSLLVGHPHQQLPTQRRRCPQSRLQLLLLVARPWRSFGLGMEGPEDDGGEGNLGRVEKNTKRAESNVAPPRPGETSTRESESAKVRVNELFFRVSGRS